MRYFLDPRHGLQAYAPETVRFLREKGISWPFQVCFHGEESGKRNVFLGSKAGAENSRRWFSRSGAVIVSEILTVEDSSKSLVLSELHSQFLSPAQAEVKCRQLAQLDQMRAASAMVPSLC